MIFEHPVFADTSKIIERPAFFIRTFHLVESKQYLKNTNKVLLSYLQSNAKIHVLYHVAYFAQPIDVWMLFRISQVQEKGGAIKARFFQRPGNLIS
jgi:acyl-CoA thioesterase